MTNRQKIKKLFPDAELDYRTNAPGGGGFNYYRILNDGHTIGVGLSAAQAWKSAVDKSKKFTEKGE